MDPVIIIVNKLTLWNLLFSGRRQTTKSTRYESDGKKCYGKKKGTRNRKAGRAGGDGIIHVVR